MKTIKFRDINRIPVQDVQPGMIIAEGIVVRVRTEQRAVFIDTVGDSTVTANHDQTAQVYGRLDDGLTQSLIAADAEAVGEGRRS